MICEFYFLKKTSPYIFSIDKIAYKSSSPDQTIWSSIKALQEEALKVRQETEPVISTCRYLLYVYVEKIIVEDKYLNIWSETQAFCS